MTTAPTASAPRPALVFSALLAVQVLFGINYVVSKIVVGTFPPLVWASFRMIMATFFMFTIALASGSKPPRGRRFFVPLIGFSLLGIVINQASFLVGLSYTTATNSAILNTLIPVFTLLIVTLRGTESLTWRRGLGFFCALAGVLAIRRIEDFSLSDRTLIGDLLTILNCLSYGCFLAFGKNFIESHSRIWSTAWLFLYGSVGLTLLALPQWVHFEPPAMTPLLVGCMLFGILGATIATYFLSLWALSHTKSSSVALFVYIQPVVAAALAWVWLGQGVTARTGLSSLLIFAGVLLALTSTSDKTQKVL